MTSPEPAITDAPRSRGFVHDAWPARVAAVLFVVLGFVPWAALLPTGLEIPGLTAQLRDWSTGLALTLGIGLLAWMASRRGHWPGLRGAPSSASGIVGVGDAASGFQFKSLGATFFGEYRRC